ncbi:hypothetical protein ACWC0A_23385 [Streptomyces scopuliridis]
MMNLDQPRARLRLDAALDGLAATFRGMTAHPDEHNRECHRGSAEDLAQLKLPDTDLDPDLLQRRWQAIDWSDHASVLRRILAQFATTLVSGLIEPHFGTDASVTRTVSRTGGTPWPIRAGRSRCPVPEGGGCPAGGGVYRELGAGGLDIPGEFVRIEAGIGQQEHRAVQPHSTGGLRR